MTGSISPARVRPSCSSIVVTAEGCGSRCRRDDHRLRRAFDRRMPTSAMATARITISFADTGNSVTLDYSAASLKGPTPELSFEDTDETYGQFRSTSRPKPFLPGSVFRRSRRRRFLAHAAVRGSTPFLHVDDLGPPEQAYRGLVAIQMTWRAPRLPLARVFTSSTAKPACFSRRVKPLSGPCDHTASTPPGLSAARAAPRPAAP